MITCCAVQVGKTMMALILCMSPNIQHASETVSTLRFGSRYSLAPWTIHAYNALCCSAALGWANLSECLQPIPGSFGTVLELPIYNLNPLPKTLTDPTDNLCGACRALGITSVCTVQKQINPEELLAENRELKKHLQRLQDQLECASGKPSSSPPEASGADSDACMRTKQHNELFSIISALQKHWVLVVLSMQMVYLCVVSASLGVH
jgi:hypothetical protein